MVGVLAIDSVQGRADLVDVPLHRRQPIGVLGDGARARQQDVEVRRFLFFVSGAKQTGRNGKTRDEAHTHAQAQAMRRSFADTSCQSFQQTGDRPIYGTRRTCKLKRQGSRANFQRFKQAGEAIDVGRGPRTSSRDATVVRRYKLPEL